MRPCSRRFSGGGVIRPYNHLIGQRLDVSARHSAHISPKQVKEGVLLLGEAAGRSRGIRSKWGLTSQLTFEMASRPPEPLR